MMPLTPSLESPNELALEAKSLLQDIVRHTHDKYGFGSLSIAVYETAWVSLVTKTVQGEKLWLFPECFHFLLKSQLPDGSWDDGSGAQIDGILNTAAALLALKRYRAQPLQVRVDAKDLDKRAEGALESLRSRLAAWDVSATSRAGFEIVAPAMLALLEDEDASIVFEFECKSALMEINKAKMAKFTPEMLHGRQFSTTIVHSLEALSGRIDYDEVAPFRTQGSMFASPSSTAAYLINATQWDDEAEAYLRHIVGSSSDQDRGGVPAVYPATCFEYAWTLSTLLRAGFQPSDLECTELSKMTDTLSDALRAGDGITGLASGFEPDLDDTAKAMTALDMLGRPTCPRRCIDAFEDPTHFRTYAGERDPRFSANCNMLASLLRNSNVSAFSSQIKKIVRYLCGEKWCSDGSVRYKWSMSPLYASMLFVEAVVDLLVRIEQESLPDLLDASDLPKLCITLFQSCLQVLLDQKSDGSWGGMSLETAFAVLILTEARRLRFFDDLEQPLHDAIERGIDVLKRAKRDVVDNVWADKVNYGSSSLNRAYILAAIQAGDSAPRRERIGSKIWQHGLPKVGDGRVLLFRQTPLLNSMPEWELHASLIEATLFEPLYEDPALQVSPGEATRGGVYPSVVPFTWTSCNNRTRSRASASILCDLMVISSLAFQGDEIMEAVIGPTLHGQGDKLRQLVDALFPESMQECGDKSNGKIHAGNGKKEQAGLGEARSLISRWAALILDHPVVRSASACDRFSLHHETRRYLLAQITHVEDKWRFGAELVHHKAFLSATSDYHRWVHSFPADDVSGPICFAFSVCLLGASMTPQACRDCFPDIESKYLAAALCHHISVMCRMYNDIGSWTRDCQEGNLNSLHFPDFGEISVDESAKKAVLYDLAQYERSCYEGALKRLEERALATPGAEARRLYARRISLIRFFTEVTDLYGQLFVIKDLSKWLRT